MFLNQEGLSEIIDSVDYAAYVFNILRIDFTISSATVQLSLNDIEGSGNSMSILLTISDLRAFSVTEYSWLCYHDINDNHALLKQFQDSQYSLYAKGKPLLFKELSFELSQVHYSVSGKWRAFNADVLFLMHQEHCLFARGPQQLIQAYADKLNAYNIATSVIHDYTPQAAESKIFILDNNYFIGSGFTFEVQQAAGDNQ